jgi:ATP-dependent Clp protease ATP-binding subunit ClpA
LARLEEWRRIFSAAVNEAASFGARHVMSDHILMALCAPGEDTVAARALQTAGVTYDDLRRTVARVHGKDEKRLPPADEWVYSTGSSSQVEGLAVGLAAGLGAEDVRAEHILLAFLWEPMFLYHLVPDYEATRRAILARLAEEGVRVPAGPLPELRLA